MTLDEVIKHLQQASKDTGWGDRQVDIVLSPKDKSLEAFELSNGMVAVRREVVDMNFEGRDPNDRMTTDEVRLWGLIVD